MSSLLGTPEDIIVDRAADGVVNAFTVDVEDYFQVSAFERHIDRSAWDSYQHRVEDNTARMLDLLARHKVIATFFILGWTARKFPDLVRPASTPPATKSPPRLLAPPRLPPDPRRVPPGISAIRWISWPTRRPPRHAYRAPSFSITTAPPGPWRSWPKKAYPRQQHLTPSTTTATAMPDAEPRPHTRVTPAGALKEFPRPSFVSAGQLPRRRRRLLPPLPARAVAPPPPAHQRVDAQPLHLLCPSLGRSTPASPSSRRQPRQPLPPPRQSLPHRAQAEPFTQILPLRPHDRSLAGVRPFLSGTVPSRVVGIAQVVRPVMLRQTRPGEKATLINPNLRYRSPRKTMIVAFAPRKGRHFRGAKDDNTTVIDSRS